MIKYIYKDHFVFELEKFEAIKILGNKDNKFCHISVLEDIKDNSLIYITEEKYLDKAINSKASVIILPFNLEEKVLKYQENNFDKTFILSKNPKLLFSYAASLFKIRIPQYGVHPTAIINSNIDANSVEIGPYVFIGNNVTIEKNAIIDAFVYIGDNSKIGENTVIFSGVKIYENCEIGKNCLIHANTVIGSDGFGYVRKGLIYNKTEHLGKVVIEDDVEIGANSCIDRATIGETRIKKGTKIDNLVQIAHNVEIGENCAICSQAGIAGGAKIGNNVTLAGQVGVSDHAIIEENVIVGAQAGISTKKYSKDQFYLGTPAIEAMKFKKSVVLFSQLPDIVKRINDLENLIKELQKK